MRIDKIHIQNFKGFEDETFKLNPRFTVFIGDNGAGKTSVCDALAVAAGGFLWGIDVAENEYRGINRKEIRNKMIGGVPRPQFPCAIVAEGEFNGKPIDEGWVTHHSSFDETALRGGIPHGVLTLEAKRMVEKSRSTGNVTFPVIAYHGTGRLWSEHEDDSPAFRKQEEGIAIAYRNCLSPKSSSKDFLSWYKTYQYEVDKIGKLEDKLQISVFNECILPFIPGAKWDSMAYSYKEEDLLFFFAKGEPEEQNFPFSQLSDGYRNVIGMVADIAYRCLKLNPHLGKNAIKETPGIVLIDELDLHLHPKWQRHIVKDLKNAFPKVQFVATTHSPFIVQSLESDELVNLDRITDVDPQDLRIDDIATDVMGVENAFSEVNQSTSLSMKAVMEKIDSGDHSTELMKAIKNITDPGVRAFLELYQMSKGS